MNTKKTPQNKKQTPVFAIVVTLTLLILLSIATAFLIFRFVFPEQFNKTFHINKPNNGNNKAPQTPHEKQPNVPLYDGSLTATFIDVKQGDSMLLTLPDKRTMLIDGGDRSQRDNVINLLKSLNITYLDYVMLTHTDEDHCGSLDDVIREYKNKIGTIYLPKIQSKNDSLKNLNEKYRTITTKAYQDIVDAALSSGGKVEYTVDKIVLNGKGYTITMFCRDENYYTNNMNGFKSKPTAQWLNDVSPITVIEYNGRKLVVTGDANGKKYSPKYSAEHNWISQMQSNGISDDDFDADVLKVGHHGSDGSSSTDFLEYIDCEYAVVSSNKGTEAVDKSKKYSPFLSTDFLNKNLHLTNFFSERKYGHPTEEVCGENGRLAKAHFKEIYYTSLHGNIFVQITKEGRLVFSTTYTPVEESSGISFKKNEKHKNENFIIKVRSILIISFSEIKKFLNQ